MKEEAKAANEFGPEYRIPCDVLLPPATSVAAGCTLLTLVKAMELRRDSGFASSKAAATMTDYTPRKEDEAFALPPVPDLRQVPHGQLAACVVTYGHAVAAPLLAQVAELEALVELYRKQGADQDARAWLAMSSECQAKGEVIDRLRADLAREQKRRREIDDEAFEYAEQVESLRAEVEAKDARIAELEADLAKAKSRGDNHWETLRSIRQIAKESGDLFRIVQWVDDAGSGYTDTVENTLAAAIDERERLRAELTAKDEELEALRAKIDRAEVSYGNMLRADDKRPDGTTDYTRGWGDCLRAIAARKGEGSEL